MTAQFVCLSRLICSIGELRVDIATLIGLVGAFGIVVAAMVTGGDVGVFVNVPSLLIVLGGSLFVVLMKFPLAHFLGLAKVAGKAFKFKSVKPEDIIAETVDLADAARKGGLLSLEDKEVSSDFMQRGPPTQITMP